MTAATEGNPAEPGGEVGRIAFLAADVLLLTGTAGEPERPNRVTLATPATTALVHDLLVVPSRGSTDEGTWLVVTVLPTQVVADVGAATLLVETPQSTLAIGAPGLEGAASDLHAVLVELVGCVDDDRRREIVEWLCQFAGRAESAEPEQLSEALFVVRETMRERLPLCELLPGARQALSVDLVLQADRRTFYLKGWCRNVGTPLSRMTAVSPEGQRSELLGKVFRHRREDVAEFYAPHAAAGEDTDYGFIATVELPFPSVRAGGWIVEIVDAEGVGVEAMGPPVQHDVTTARQLMLFDLVYERTGEDSLRREHVARALLALQERWHRSIGPTRIADYGTQPKKPAVTIIIPLYHRLEFLEHQLVQFVHDDEIAANELLYVLDSPEDEAWLRQLAMTLFPLYRVPFRTVVMSHNGGFAAANNVAASIARGKKLLLLNSDVIPDRPGWLGQMTSFYDETPDVGALGVKLLYEDNSIQHAGLYFKRVSVGNEWNNEHLFKGLHRTFPGANVTRRVPAVTAACMMVDRRLFEKVGGLRTAYVQGDYEDSDLCLRLARLGKCAWYLPAVELYHLEAQSYPSALRLQTSHYNRWLHTHLWGDDIERIATAWDGAASARRPAKRRARGADVSAQPAKRR